VHTTGLPPTQTPSWHEWLFTHWSAPPSVQIEPFGSAGFEQVPVCGSHVPAA
jgi:hypothetical protein